MNIQPREYQLESLEAILSRQKEGVTRQLVCMPTGTGKTIIFGLLAKELEDLIIKCRKSAPCYGPKRLKRAYEKIKASESAIARILKQNNLTRKRRKKYQRKQDLRKVKAKYKEGKDILV